MRNYLSLLGTGIISTVLLIAPGAAFAAGDGVFVGIEQQEKKNDFDLKKGEQIKTNTALSPDMAIVKINSRPVPKWAYDFAFKMALTTTHSANAKEIPLVPEVRKRVLDQIVAKELLFQAGEKYPVDNIKAKIDASIQSEKEVYGGDKGLAEWLASVFLTMENYRELIKKDIIISSYIDNVLMSGMNVADGELNKYYGEHKAEFDYPAQACVSHILFAVPEGAKPEKVAEVKSRAEDVLRLIKGGADFGEMAQKHSQHYASARKGGYLGYVEFSEMADPFREACKTVPVGEVTGPYRSQDGFNLVKVTDRVDAGSLTPDQAKGLIYKKLMADRETAVVNKKLEELKKNMKLEEVAPHM